MSLFREFKRRNVFRVGAAYIIIAWLIMQVGDTLAPALYLPDWSTSLLAFFLALGFPLAILFAWAFELTPEGFKREKDVDQSSSITHRTGRTLDFVIIGLLSVAVVFLVLERSRVVVDEVLDKSVAVLPFDDLSPSQNHAFFADGLAEEILNALARTPDLLVESRTSSFTFRGSEKNVQDIARELGVAYILEGSVRRAEDGLRVTAQLIRAADGTRAWSENYDRPVDDLISVQENIATQIANALQTAMDPAALARMVSAGTSSVPAFEAYLEGLSARSDAAASGVRETYLKVRDAFEMAIWLDPEFALAHRQLAVFWHGQLMTSMHASGLTDLPFEDLRSRYEAAIDGAINHEQDPVSKLGHKAYKARHDYKLHEALNLNSDYLEQRPNDRSAHQLQLSILRRLGKTDEAVRQALEFWDNYGDDARTTGYSIELLRYSADAETQRRFVNSALQRFANHSDILYQAHRNMLWIGDIEAARRILAMLYSTDWAAHRRFLANLRQACADGRQEDAAVLYADGIEQFSDRVATVWLSHMLMGNVSDAVAVLMGFDKQRQFDRIYNYLSYGFFDPRPFTNLINFLEERGIPVQKPLEIPYACNWNTSARIR